MSDDWLVFTRYEYGVSMFLASAVGIVVALTAFMAYEFL
jgi:hypothetical protein